MKTLLVLILSSSLYAGAILPNKDNGELFLTLAKYKSDTRYDEDSNKSSFNDGGEFSKTELSYYLIYSFYKKWAFIATGSIYGSLTFKNDFNTLENSSLGDQKIGVRRAILQSTYAHFSVQALLSFPLYSREGDPLIGNHQSDLELRAMYDQFQLFDIDFITIEGALVKRFERPADQYKLDFSIGERSLDILFIGNIFYTQSLRNGSGNIGNVNPNLLADWDQLKLGVSGVYDLMLGYSVQLGIFEEIYGRNIGVGTTYYLSLWKRF